MHEYIDQLIINGKYEEAIPLIEEVWEKRGESRERVIADLARRLDALEDLRKRNYHGHESW
ncbi:hypothetical protein [Legionella resiliens]|uniref:Uncharacterized protein n=1 Tax=Legionella resiliens TaxID=2905958 RepID=A0ABS8X5V4_9GAMM|nr:MULTISPECIES: hypothetical protein [unclassified Legionella]MCE0723986.1 hypothetical protein [Legionella sp. 9fVS26]MCE3533139.1 hypothetical protein [Legionella sp. 8cVS16]